MKSRDRVRSGGAKWATVMAALLGAIAASPSAQAAGPAVQALNGRIGAGY